MARRLKGVVGEIRSQYQADWKSPEMKARQRAVALYFIDKVRMVPGFPACCSQMLQSVSKTRLDGQLGGPWGSCVLSRSLGQVEGWVCA